MLAEMAAKERMHCTDMSSRLFGNEQLCLSELVDARLADMYVLPSFIEIFSGVTATEVGVMLAMLAASLPTAVRFTMEALYGEAYATMQLLVLEWLGDGTFFVEPSAAESPRVGLIVQLQSLITACHPFANAVNLLRARIECCDNPYRWQLLGEQLLNALGTTAE